MTQEARNRTTWSRASSRRWLDAADEDRGERMALDRVRERARGKPILDLGVGTGRTIPLLAPLTDEYRAIDYLAPMVDECRARHPEVRVELGDARDLARVPAHHFGLVVFSFNGIDAVGHADRLRVLAEMRRVVRADGAVLFSTLNLGGPAFRERPWRPNVGRSRSALRHAVRTARAWAMTPFDVARWARLRLVAERGDGWALAPLSAHHYGVLAHFTTLARQLCELEDAGLGRDVIVLDNETGARITANDDTSKSSWFHFIAHAS
jgi:SAM-dependent methyltransferase